MDFSAFLNFDAAVFQWVNKIHDYSIDAIIEPVLVFLTNLFDTGIFWIILAAVLFCFKKTRRAGLTMAAALLVMMVCNNLVLKNLLARPRPFNLDWPAMKDGWKYVYPGLVDQPHSYSFPSGHSSSGFAAATGLCVSKKPYLYIPGLLLAAIVAFSRIYVMVHYPTDVIFGALFGVIYGLIAIFICKWIIKMVNDKTKLGLFRA
ncbi:MAG: phosphatase PAP2 family protein [Clostridia bacterium]|nr:phosphatase PAP2 family protein [Clostridia bacterium]